MPGHVPALVFDRVDASRTPGGTVVRPEVAASRAQIRSLAVAGGNVGGVIPLPGEQSIDARTLAGALVSGGSFLPLVFGGPAGLSALGGPGGTSPTSPTTPAGGPVLPTAGIGDVPGRTRGRGQG